jgi:hypothetical protein
MLSAMGPLVSECKFSAPSTTPAFLSLQHPRCAWALPGTEQNLQGTGSQEPFQSPAHNLDST